MEKKGRWQRLSSMLAAMGLAAILLAFSGCKAQQQLQQQVTDLEGKLADSQKRVTALEAELKKTNFEVTQLKGLVTKLGNVAVDLQKAEEERQKQVAEARARAEMNAAKKKPLAKKAAPRSGKKRK